MQVLLVYKKTHEPVHDHALGHLREVLEGHGGALTVTLRPRELVKQSDFLGRDLVIVLGGDGTLTSISHNIDDTTLVMGVNSHPRADDPDGSVGFYMDSDVDTFDNDLRAVLEGSAIVNRLPRLQAVIETTSGNRFTTDPALNDLLIANTHQYAPSKYRMTRGNHDTFQTSSGLLFATWFGQHAWLSHAAPMAAFEACKAEATADQAGDHCFILARDLPIAQRQSAPWAHMAWSAESTVLVSDMHRGYVVPDGWDEVHFNRGATITVDARGPPLNLLTFRHTMLEKVAALG
ncbi:MAG: hypothetical protein CL991_04065 [Euryarchaeota archaeon]|nr:hypothetical protein [Euryarchaeota archaeon]